MAQSVPSAFRRRSILRRKSRETEVIVDLDLDAKTASAKIDSGIGFLDHMLSSLATHAGWKLELICRGDLVIDDHHSAEDCALALGEALARAVAAGQGGGQARIKRFGSAHAPLDEALARAVVDFSGRPFCRAELGLSSSTLGGLAAENVQHFFWSIASAAKMTLHLHVLEGYNDHHKAEAAFKALALALREALCLMPASEASAAAGDTRLADSGEAASTKGSVLLEAIGPEEWARESARLAGTPTGAPSA